MKSEVAPFLYLVVLDGAATCMAPAEEEQFSVRVVFPRIGVRYDGKGSALGDFVDQRHDFRDFIFACKDNTRGGPARLFAIYRCRSHGRLRSRA